MIMKISKFRILAAVLLFVAEFCLLIWPVSWLGSDQKMNYLTGEDSWALLPPPENAGYCQEFSPDHVHLKSVGIVLTTAGEPLGTGDITVTISDSHDKILFSQTYSFDRFALDGFELIDVNLSLRPGAHYFLSADISAEDADTELLPTLKACGTEYYVPENLSLTVGERIDNAQLVTMYVYDRIVSGIKILKALLLCGITALGMAFGLPKNKYFRKALAILLLAAGPCILGQRLEMLAFDYYYNLHLPFSMRWNVGLMYLLELILLLCSQSPRFSICVSNLLLTLLYSANFYVWTFRGEPLRPNDFLAAGTAASVLSRFNLQPNEHLAMVWCLLVLFLVLGAQTSDRKPPQTPAADPASMRVRRRRTIGFVAGFTAGIAIAIGSGYTLLYTSFLTDIGFSNENEFARDNNYIYDGYLVASLIEIQNNRNSIKASMPAGYSTEAAEALLKAAAQNQSQPTGETLPHIILIMNESFSDLRVLGNLQISQENLSFFNSLEENTVRGYVNASGLGGGTANSEFEVITGCSMGLLPPGYIPYQQCITRPMSTLISDISDAGYTTYSIHPEPKANWHRGTVYEFFGFDHSLWKGDFEAPERVHNWVSDMETYRKVEELFESREDGERLFIFDLTMQNHGGYTEPDVEEVINVLNVSSSEADAYLSLINESDKAFEQLITYFRQQEEPVIVCMFGDHQPKITQEGFYDEIFRQTKGITERDKILNMYKTPFIIWANYDIPEQTGLDIGMNYLGALLLEVAELPCSPYFSFLQQYMREYPLVSVHTYMDKDGNYYDWSGDDSALTEYRILQYHYLFDTE